MNEILILALLLIAGAISGFINTIAGGGSLLALLTMLLIGVPSTVANATNRVSICAQSVVATIQFRRAQKLAPLNDWLSAALPGLAGAALGAVVAAELPTAVFDILLAIILLLLIAALFLRPKLWLEEHRPTGPAWLRIPVFCVIGAYGGLAQTGIGLLLIPAISLLFGYELVRVNALKVAVIAGIAALSVVIFSIFGLVIWQYGLILAGGSVVGAHFGVRFALRRGSRAIRWILAIMALLSALKLLLPAFR